MSVTISAYNVVTAKNVGSAEKIRIEERCVYNVGNKNKARRYAESYAIQTGQSTYVCDGGPGYLYKYFVTATEDPKSGGRTKVFHAVRRRKVPYALLRCECLTEEAQLLAQGMEDVPVSC